MNGSLAGADTSPLHADAMNAKAAARASRRVRTHGGIVDMTRATTPDGFGRFAPSVASLCPSVDRGRTSECRPGHTRLSRAPGNRASPRTRCRAVVTVARRDRSSRRGIAGHRRASPGIAGHRGGTSRRDIARDIARDHRGIPRRPKAWGCRVGHVCVPATVVGPRWRMPNLCSETRLVLAHDCRQPDDTFRENHGAISFQRASCRLA